jgi:predicted kinase
MGEDTFATVLLVINGAPAVGKTTLARRYADEHALALVIDIDAIRTSLGKWADVEESKLVARDLALALVRAHLLARHDVIVPQYFGRQEFVERLRHVADEMNTVFVEAVLIDDPDEVVKRFRQRRSEYAAAAVEHPESDLGDGAIAAAVLDAHDRLVRDAAARGVHVISAGGGPDASYRELRRILAGGS